MELIFPPLWTPIETVYLSTPSLKAFLEEKGYRTHQTDLSIEFWDSIFSKKHMEHVEDQINREMDELSRSPSTDKLEVEKYNTLLMARALLENVPPDLIDEARGTVKGRGISIFEIRDVGGILSDATYIISSVYYPTRIRFDAFLTRHYYDHSLPNLMSTIKNEKENPFIDFYHFFNVPTKILDKADGVIGFSLGSFDQLIPSLTLANLIKQIDPHVFIVFGGAILPYMGRSLEVPPLYQMVDGFIIGEGETPLYHLVDSLDNNRSLDEVPNFMYKDPSGRIRKSQTHTIEDVNALPTPSFEDLDLGAYYNSARVVPLLTSRGCYWNKCAFCSLCSTYGSKYRERDMNSVIDDIKKLYDDQGIEFFLFNDESITAHRLDLISDAILKEGLDIYWIALIRLEKGFTRAIFEKAFKAGCRIISTGLESGSQRVLDLMEKGITVDTAMNTIKNAHDSKLWTNVFTIFGFPGETAEEARMTTEVVMKIHDIIDSNPIGICRVEYGSKLYLDREKYGIALQDNYDYKLIHRRDFDEYTVSGSMSKEEVIEAMNYHYQSTMKYPLYIGFHEGVSAEEILIWLKNRTRDDFIELYVGENIRRKQLIEKEKQILEQKKGDAVVSLQPDVVYNQVAMRGYDGREIIQCVLFSGRTHSFAGIVGSFKDFLDLCTNQRTLNDIFAQLSEKYNVPKDRLMNSLLPVINMLLGLGSFFTVH